MRAWIPLLAAAAAVAACSRNDVHPPSHERMVKLLDELAAKADVDNPFFGHQRLDTLQKQLQEAGPRADWRLRWETATAALEQGLEREAIDLLTATHEAIARGQLAADPAGRVGVAFQLGLAWLRFGETENCCKLPNQERCFTPSASVVSSSQEPVPSSAPIMAEKPLPKSCV